MRLELLEGGSTMRFGNEMINNSYYESEEKKTYEKCPHYSNKNKYSYKEVLIMKKAITKGSHGRSHNKIFLREYRCPYCSAYHLTSQKTKIKYAA